MSSIWFNPNIDLKLLNSTSKNTMSEWLGIEFIEVGDDFIKATMPVNERTHQPAGLLHGGASAALAETVGSIAGWLCVDASKQSCVGLELNCNHIRGMKSGTVIAVGKAFHIGKTTQVWEIKITNEKDKLVCISRLTLAVINIPQPEF